MRKQHFFIGAGTIVLSAGQTLQAGEQDIDEVVFVKPGEGVDLFGRQAAAIDLQRGGTRQPSPPQDAKEHLPGADQTELGAPHGIGPVARDAVGRSTPGR